MALSRRAIGKQRRQRARELLGVARGERPALLVERPVDVGEIADMRPVQDGAGELCGLDRILSAAGKQRLAHEHDPRQPVEQPEFADRVADIDGAIAPGPLASRAQPAREPHLGELPGDLLAALGMARRDQRQEIGIGGAKLQMGLGGRALLAAMGGRGDPQPAPGDEAGKLGEFAMVGRRRRRVEFHIADDGRRARAQLQEALGVGRALGEQQVEPADERARKARRAAPSGGTSVRSCAR